MTIATLTDSDFTLTGDSDCQVGTILPVGGWCDFTQTEFIAGDASDPDHSNTFTATATDNDGNTATDDDDATVTFDDVLPMITLNKAAFPTTLLEPGGDFLFTLDVHNTSVEAVTITALTDDNALSEECLALIGTTLAAGASTSCQYSVMHTEAGRYDNTASITVMDNDLNQATATADASVTVTDILPTITVLKTAVPTSVNEPGANVVFTFKVTNTAVEPVTIATLTDSDFTLTGDSDCQVGTILPVGGWCDFTQTEFIAGDASDPDHSNTFTATATDNDGNTATDDDVATVTFDDVPPTITVLKTAAPTSVNEPGANVVFTFKVTNTCRRAGDHRHLDRLRLHPDRGQRLPGRHHPAGGRLV